MQGMFNTLAITGAFNILQFIIYLNVNIDTDRLSAINSTACRITSTHRVLPTSMSFWPVSNIRIQKQLQLTQEQSSCRMLNHQKNPNRTHVTIRRIKVIIRSWKHCMLFHQKFCVLIFPDLASK